MSDINEATIGFFARRELLRYAREAPDKISSLLEAIELAILNKGNIIKTYGRRPDGSIDDKCYDSNTIYQFNLYSGRIELFIEPPGSIGFSDDRVLIQRSGMPVSTYSNLKHNAIGTKLSVFIKVDGIDIDAMVPKGITDIGTMDIGEDEWLRLAYELEGTSYLETLAELRKIIATSDRGGS